MRKGHWIWMGVAAALLVGAQPGFPEELTVGEAARDLGGGLYTIGAGWTEAPEAVYRVSKEDNPVSGAVFGPAEGTARGIQKVNEGLFRTGTLLLPTWEEIKREGALKKTFYF